MQRLDLSHYAADCRRLVRRDQRRDPKMPNCAIGLRRICGTCSAFPPDAEIRAKAQLCSVRKIEVDGPRCAASCPLWSRKSAPVSINHKGIS